MRAIDDGHRARHGVGRRARDRGRRRRADAVGDAARHRRDDDDEDDDAASVLLGVDALVARCARLDGGRGQDARMGGFSVVARCV